MYATCIIQVGTGWWGFSKTLEGLWKLLQGLLLLPTGANHPVARETSLWGGWGLAEGLHCFAEDLAITCAEIIERNALNSNATWHKYCNAVSWRSLFGHIIGQL